MKALAQRVQSADIRLSDRILGKTPFSSGYWVQKRLRDSVSDSVQFAKGTLLDIGCGNKPYEPLFRAVVDRYIGVEYSPESGFDGNRADFCADAVLLPLDGASVETILCTEVLEHLCDPEAAISEFSRVLKPNGVLITTAPFFYPVHDTRDFFRYTGDGLAEMMGRHQIEIESMKPLSGGGVMLAIMFNLYFYDICFIWTKALYPVGLILRPVLLLIVFFVNILGRVADVFIRSPQFAFNHVTIGRKKA